jgi:hypothetical protein
VIFSHTETGVTKPLSLTVALVVSLERQLIGNSLQASVTLAASCNVTNGEANLTVQVVGLTKIASGCTGLSFQLEANISSSYISTSKGVSVGPPISTYHSCSSIGFGCLSLEGRFCKP